MSVIHRCQQGSPEWVALRLGKPTASRFDMLMTPGGKPSDSAVRLRNELIAEYLIGEPIDGESSGFMERGSKLEERAVAFYEMQRDVDVERVGFISTDDGRAGCSPDGLVGENVGVEIKCPSAAVHVGYMLDGAGNKYRAQVQGSLMISEREFWDFLSFHPTMPPALVRCVRDEPFIKTLRAVLDEFCDRLAAAREELLARDIKPLPLKMSYAEARDFYVGAG